MHLSQKQVKCSEMEWKSILTIDLFVYWNISYVVCIELYNFLISSSPKLEYRNLLKQAFFWNIWPIKLNFS